MEYSFEVCVVFFIFIWLVLGFGFWTRTWFGFGWLGSVFSFFSRQMPSMAMTLALKKGPVMEASVEVRVLVVSVGF